MNDYFLYETYLNNVFKRAFYSCHNLSETSGEILPLSVKKMLSPLALTSNDIIADLGSGTGKLAAQLFLQTEVKEVWGIELRKELHQGALLANEQMKQELSAFYLPPRQLRFFLGSFLEHSLEGLTIALVNSVCISQQTLLLLEKRLNALSSLRYVLTTRPMVTLKIPFFKTIRIECSWDTALCYIYRSKTVGI